MEVTGRSLVSAIEKQVEFIGALKKRIEYDLKRNFSASALKKPKFRLTGLVGDSTDFLAIQLEAKIPEDKLHEYNGAVIYPIKIKYIAVAHLYPLDNKAQLVPRGWVDIKPVKSFLRDLGYRTYKIK